MPSTWNISCVEVDVLKCYAPENKDIDDYSYSAFSEAYKCTAQSLIRNFNLAGFAILHAGWLGGQRPSVIS
jgi:hypothetical protein